MILKIKNKATENNTNSITSRTLPLDYSWFSLHQLDSFPTPSLEANGCRKSFVFVAELIWFAGSLALPPMQQAITALECE